MTRAVFLACVEPLARRFPAGDPIAGEAGEAGKPDEDAWTAYAAASRAYDAGVVALRRELLAGDETMRADVAPL